MGACGAAVIFVAGPLLALDLFTRPAVAADCCRGAIDAGLGELDQSAVFDYVRTLA